MTARGSGRLTLGGMMLLASVISGCGGTASGGGDASGTVTIPVLYAAGDSGGIEKVEVAVSESSDKSMRVVFSENEVTGIGAMTRASMWNVAVVSTLVAGRAPNLEFSVAIPGRVDGDSAGAVMTVGRSVTRQRRPAQMSRSGRPASSDHTTASRSWGEPSAAASRSRARSPSGVRSGSDRTASGRTARMA